MIYIDFFLTRNQVKRGSSWHFGAKPGASKPGKSSPDNNNSSQQEQRPATSRSLPLPQHDARSSMTTTSSPPLWPDLADNHPLFQLHGKLDSILAEASHDEMYGINLSTASPFHRNLILQKFLRANSNDVSKASSQLLSALKWRKSYNPTSTVQETFSANASAV